MMDFGRLCSIGVSEADASCGIREWVEALPIPAATSVPGGGSQKTLLEARDRWAPSAAAAVEE
jgi:hypothetical protein